MTPSPGRRPFFVASLLGSVVSFAIFAWVLAADRFAFMVREPFGNFYDAQARALLHGHWNVSASELAFEGFRIGDKTYTYFGPWPSILRMPLIQFAPSTYGRLTQLSMLLAFATMLVGVAALHWRIRDLLRGDATVCRLDLVLAVAAPIALGAGSSALFLASRAWVYHEAILWGVAWALLAYERIIAFSRAPSVARLVGASAAATLAFSSRASVGLGPVVAIGLVLAGQMVAWVRTGRRTAPDGPTAAPDETSDPRWIPRTLAAVVVPVMAYMYVNWARFDSLLSVPWRKQVIFSINESARGPLDANHGTYFALKYVPTTLLHYLRPDALAGNGLFPWLTFPRFRPMLIGHPVMTLDVSSSVTASMPALALLTIVGVLAASSRRFARSDRARLLCIPLIGAAVGTVLVLTIAFIAQRYLGDWLPFIVMGSLAGLHTLVARREAAPAGRRLSTSLLAGVAVLSLAGVWINLSLALWFQRLDSAHPESLRAEFITTQYRISAHLGTGTPMTDFVTDLPPTPARSGTTAVVGPCAGIYWSDGDRWQVVAGTPEGGVFTVIADQPPVDAETWFPIISWLNPTGPDVLALRHDRDGFRVSRSFANPDGSLQFPDRDPPARVDPGVPLRIEIVKSDPLRLFRVRINGIDAWQRNSVRDLPAGQPTIATAPADASGVSTTFPTLRAAPPDRRVCRAIRAAQRG